MSSCLFFEISEQSESEQTAQTARLLLRDLLNERAGIVQEDAFEVTERAAGANDSVDIAPGGLFIPGTESGVQGFYYFVNESITNLQMAEPANATLPRIDSIVAHVNDAFYSGSVYECVIEWVVGTEDADPDPPDLAALGYTNYWRLADIDIPANDNVVVDDEIIDERTDGTLTPAQSRAVAVSGIGVATSTTLNTLFPNPREGQHVWLEDDKTVVVWSSGDAAWVVAAQQHELPMASALRTGTQSIPTATLTVLQINSTTYDTDGIVSLANNRMVVQTPGLYDFNSVMTRDSGLDGVNARMSFRKNGTVIPGDVVAASNSLFGGSWVISRQAPMNAGDTIDVVMFHSGSGNRVFRHREFNINFRSRLPE